MAGVGKSCICKVGKESLLSDRIGETVDKVIIDLVRVWSLEVTGRSESVRGNHHSQAQRCVVASGRAPSAPRRDGWRSPASNMGFCSESHELWRLSVRPAWRLGGREPMRVGPRPVFGMGMLANSRWFCDIARLLSREPAAVEL